MRRTLFLLGLLFACGRTNDDGPLQVAVSSEIDVLPAPGSSFELAVLVRNTRNAPVRLVEASLQAYGQPLSATESSGNADLIDAGSQTNLLFVVSVPIGAQELEIVAHVVAFDTSNDVVLRGNNASAPWRLVNTGVSPSTDLVVSVLDDELDGGDSIATVEAAGGAGDLSLREAIAIANNRPGADRIEFSASVFSAGSPGEIGFDNALGKIEITENDTTIDASDRGIRIIGNAEGPVLDVRANGVTIDGIAIVDVSREALNISGAGSVHLRNSSFSSVSVTNGTGGLVKISDSVDVQLENNAINRGLIGLGIYRSERVTVRQNAFQDPSRAIVLQASTQTRVVENEFVFVGGVGLRIQGGSENTVESNRMIDVGDTCIIIEDASDENRVVRNQLYGCGDVAIRVSGSSRDNQWRENSITNTDGPAIVLSSGANRDVSPPALTGLQPPQGTSSAPEGSFVDVYGDPDGEALTFLGSTAVDASGNWSLNASPALTPATTVTAIVTTADGSSSALSTPLAVP